MAPFLSVQTSTIILGVVAGVYSVISVLFLACICCLCQKRRKIRSVSPSEDCLAPCSSEVQMNPGSDLGSTMGTKPVTDVSSATAQENQLPSRYRSKGRKKAIEAETCPEWEGVRDSPMLRQRDAWSLDKTTEDLTSHPRTPDSGLAPSLGETVSRRGLADSPNGSSRGSQVADPTEDNVFDDNLSRSHLSKSFEESRRDIRKRAPKPLRTESNTPLIDDDNSDLCSPGSDMEFNLKDILPPIREKVRSLDSLDGSFFVNKSAIASEESEKTVYTELSTIKTDSLNKFPPSFTIGVDSRRELLPPIQSTPLGPGPVEGQVLTKIGRLPPLHPPGHSQENLHETAEEESTTL